MNARDRRDDALKRAEKVEPQEELTLGVDDDATLFVSARTLRRRADWFIKLRWSVVLGAGGVTVLSWPVTWTQLDLRPILAVIILLALVNTAYLLRNLRTPPRVLLTETRYVKTQMVVDLFLLTVLLNLTGGLENPFHVIYFVHVIIASLLFKGREIFHIAALAIVLFTCEVVGEYFGLLPHHHLFAASGMHHQSTYMLMTLGVYWLVLLFSAYIGSSIMKHNRAIKNELVARQKQLIAQDKAKMDFFRFVTHEVKNPAITSQSAIDAVLVLSGDELSPMAKDLLERARRRTAQTIDIVKDLADLTRGAMQDRQETSRVNLNVKFKEWMDDFAERAAERKIEVVTRFPPVPVILNTNEQAIEKIFVNLYSNALRYSPEGGRITVRLFGAGFTRVSFSVRDRGIGIAPKDQQKIFEEFYRTPEAKRMSTEGTGLGLPIVKRLVGELGGRLTVASVPGQGSIFTVSGLHNV